MNTQFDHFAEDLEQGAERFTEDSVGVQFLSAKDIIDHIGAATVLSQDLGSIAVKQAEYAFRDYAALTLSSDDPAKALLEWAGRRTTHRAEGMLAALRTMSAEADRLAEAHDAAWAGFREVM